MGTFVSSIRNKNNTLAVVCKELHMRKAGNETRRR
jgi:hypothetical protein